MNLSQMGHIQYTIDAHVMKKIDEASDDVTYIGYTQDKNATTAQAKWRIIRISKVGTVTTFSLADGDEEFDNIWDNRATTVSYLPA